MEIEAKDQGDPAKSSRAPLRVTVIDSNDLNPVFKHQFYSSSRVKVRFFQMFGDRFLFSSNLKIPVYVCTARRIFGEARQLRDFSV